MPPDSPHDVLIIGGGPAGASAAIRARQAGLRTLVVEKETFPRFRVGESLLPAGNVLLQQLGVWQKISRAGFIEKHGARFLLGTGDAEKKVLFAHGLVPGLDQTYQVDRARFDALLLDHARELGAEIRTQTTVRALTFDAEGATATLESSAPASESASVGDSSILRARYVIDASGRDQFFPSELKTALEPAAFPKRLAIYSHFHRVPRDAGPSGGDTLIVRLPEGWFWLIPIDAERTSVGLVTTQAAFKAARLSPADHFARVVADSPRLRNLLADAKPTMEFHVTADYSYYRRELASERFVLAGDAGGFLDPIFSSGAYLALYSAKHAAELVVRAHRTGRPLAPAERRRYTRRLKTHARVFHRLIEAFYDDASFSVFMCPQPPLNLAPGITSIVAGHAHLTFGLWWRFRIFLLVCRLQRRWPLVPRLDLHPAHA
jgi:flavin-dependent dehydrogenase